MDIAIVMSDFELARLQLVSYFKPLEATRFLFSTLVYKTRVTEIADM